MESISQPDKNMPIEPARVNAVFISKVFIIIYPLFSFSLHLDYTGELVLIFGHIPQLTVNIREFFWTHYLHKLKYMLILSSKEFIFGETL